MTRSTTRDPAEVDAFLTAFFGEGNTIQFDRGSAVGEWLAPSLRALETASDVPVVLPRRLPEHPNRRIAYIIARDARHAAEVADLLSAFVGPSFSYFDGRPARLAPQDPVERAVLDFCGASGTTFTLYGPTAVSDQQVWRALRLLQTAVEMRPARLTTVRKPLGRLLAEFDAGLAAGDHSASAAVLDQLAADAGLSAANLAHLRIKRLARLGRDTELLRLPALPDVVLAGPPAPVVDDVLTALFTTALAAPLAAGDLAAAREILLERGSVVVPTLAESYCARLGPEAASVLAFAAWIRGDATLLRRLITTDGARIREIAPRLADALDDTLARVAPDVAIAPGAVDEATVEPEVALSGWPELMSAITRGSDLARTALTEQTWRQWPQPATADKAVADVLATLDDTAAEAAWSAVGAFIDADGYGHPATRSAREFITNALSHGRFGPGDLAAVVALTDIVLRGGPGGDDYRVLLDDLGAECNRWVAPERATPVLDLADHLTRHACPDEEARLRLAFDLLGPLHAHAARLDPDQVAVAQILSRDLDVDIGWPEVADAEDGSQVGAATGTILLYSLDEGVLGRASAALAGFAPYLRIVLSFEKVGGPRLRQHARGADYVVLATRCATHAATGFIQANMRADAVLAHADGSGSASLLRAAFSCLRGRTPA